MRGLMIFANKMEDNEALSTLALLKRAGYNIESASIEDDFLVTTSYGLECNADRLLYDLNLDNYDFLIIPGGPYSKEILQSDQIIKKTAKEFNQKNKMIAAICAAPAFLGVIGLLDGKEFTCIPGMENYAPKGTYLADKKAVTDANIITARSAGAVIEYVYEIIKYLDSEDSAKDLLKKLMY